MFDFSKRWKWHKEQQPGSICLVCTHASRISALWSTVPPYLVLTTLFTLQMQATCKSFEFQEQLLSNWSYEQFIVFLQRVNGQWKYIYMETIWRKGCPNDIFQSRYQRQRCSMIKPTSMQIHELTILISVHCTFRDTILVCCRRRIVQSLYSLHCYCARVQVGFTQRGRLQLGDGVRGGNSGFFCFCLITRKRFNRRRLDTKLQIQRFSEKAWWIEFREEDAAALLFTGQKSKL